MTITAPSKPSTFKRSSERKVGDPNELLVIEADRALQAQVAAFEELGLSADSSGRLVSTEKSERLVDAMLSEDISRFDAEGRVY